MKNHSSTDISLSDCKNLEQEEAFRLILDNAEDTFLLVDKNLRILLANEATKAKARQYFNVTLTKGSSVLDLAPPDKHGFLRKLYAEVFEGAIKTTVSKLQAGSTVRYLENHFKPAKNRHGLIVGAVVSTRDITEKKQAEASQQKVKDDLRFSEQQYKMLFENNPLPCWIYDFATRRFLEVNEAATRYYGYTKEEFLQLSVFDLQVEENLADLQDRFATKKIKRIHFLNNWQHRLKDGRTIFVDLRSSAILYRGIKARLVVAQDVTRRVVTESELRNSNERFKLAAKASSEALWEWNIQTHDAYISPIYTEIFGWEADEFRKFDEWPDYIHPDDEDETVTGYAAAIENPAIEKWEKEYRYLKSDGSYAFVHDKAVIVRDEQGKAVKVVGALQNISEQKEIAEELIKSNERFLLASRAASDAIYDWNISSNELQWGEGMQTLFGFHPHEVSMARWEALIHPKDRDRVNKSLADALNHPTKKIWKEEYLFSKNDGSFSYVLDRGFIVRNEKGKPVRMIGSLQDITERKHNEQLLSLERAIFEKSANPGWDLKEVVETLLKGIEEIYPEMITSVLLLKEDDTVQHLASPRLPAAFTAGINGLRIGPEVGSCGTAMFLKKTVIVADIENDPLWIAYKDFTLSFNLRACWSLPIIHTSGKVMGSFAVYYTKPHYPTAAALSTFERFRNILRIVIENRLSLQEIKIANERFDIMMKATHDLVWDWNLETNIIYRDAAGLKTVYGLDDNFDIASTEQWLNRIHPDDKERAYKAITDILQSADENNFDIEYRFRRDDGTYSYVYDRGVIMRNNSGKPIRMIGAAQDVSERKRLEKELLANELEYQKAINRASIETQEQERTEIGKELHDNVNQVLTTTKLYLDLALSNPELKDELIEKSTKNVITVINEIRQLSRSLMNPSIGDLGLTDAIHDLIENINLTRKLHVSLKARVEIEDLLDKNQKLTIFRIIQEALNNAIRHAKATSVVIHFRHDASSVEVIIEDDGVGFNVETVKKGAGLKNIQNRIYLINGTHKIESIPNKGSKISINFPLTKATIV